MEWHNWLAFSLAAAVVLAIPGPTILLVLVQSITHGPRAALPLVAGVAVGDFIAVTCSLLGLGVILAASATLFTLLKWIGAAYLIYLGVRMWRQPPQLGNLKDESAEAPAGKLFRNACLVTALNPKGIIFFLAFVPQFVEPTGNAHFQLALMALTFLLLATLNAALYAYFAGQIRVWLRHPETLRWFQRGGGSALIGAGMLTALAER